VNFIAIAVAFTLPGPPAGTMSMAVEEGGLVSEGAVTPVPT
jgi:hypothetical protein